MFDFDKFLNELASKADKLHALIAIKFAVLINKPISKDDIRQAIEEIHISQKNLKDKRSLGKSSKK